MTKGGSTTVTSHRARQTDQVEINRVNTNGVNTNSVSTNSVSTNEMNSNGVSSNEVNTHGVRTKAARKKATGIKRIRGNRGSGPALLLPQGQAHLKTPAYLKTQDHLKIYNRIGAVMSHVPWYSFKSQARLASDLGFSKSAVSRLLREETSPSLALALALTRTLEQRLGKPLDLRELFSLDGTYPTPSACALVGCANCLPAQAYDSEDNLRPEYKNVQAGQWSIPVRSKAPAQKNLPVQRLVRPALANSQVVSDEGAR